VHPAGVVLRLLEQRQRLVREPLEQPGYAGHVIVASVATAIGDKVTELGQRCSYVKGASLLRVV